MEKELRWDDIEVGEEVVPLEYEISEELIDKFAKAIDDYDDWYVYLSNVEIRLSEIYNFSADMIVSFGSDVPQARIDGDPVSNYQNYPLSHGIHNFWCVSNSYPLPEGYEEDIEVTE